MWVNLLTLRIEQYNDSFEEKWDKFVLSNSINGTFLQTRSFLNYHPSDRFKDNSLVIFKGNTTIIAVIPACTIYENREKVLYSHLGSTFGGIIINRSFNNIDHINGIMQTLNDYLKEKNFNKIVLKNASDLFSNGNINLLNYFLFKDGFLSYDEVSFYINFKEYKDDLISNFTSSRRRDYKYSLKNNLKFKKLIITEEIELFYQILCNNLKKFDSKPVHSLEELIDFKENRLKDIVDFYGVYKDNILIAGSMVFKFGKSVFHTQYLAADQSYLNLYPMNYLDTNLIKIAKEEGFEYFSFGISTENHGKTLNYNLANFKEGFGTTYSLNKTFYKSV